MGNIIPDKLYDWMLDHFPFKIMYVKRQIDTQHFMWFPRWGYSKKKMEDAKKRAEDLYNNINWD